jgi:hypothetical protein
MTFLWVSVSYLFFQLQWYDREERKMHLSRDTSSVAENETKDIPNKITDFRIVLILHSLCFHIPPVHIVMPSKRIKRQDKKVKK